MRYLLWIARAIWHGPAFIVAVAVWGYETFAAGRALMRTGFVVGANEDHPGRVAYTRMVTSFGNLLKITSVIEGCAPPEEARIEELVIRMCATSGMRLKFTKVW